MPTFRNLESTDPGSLQAACSLLVSRRWWCHDLLTRSLWRDCTLRRRPWLGCHQTARLL